MIDIIKGLLHQAALCCLYGEFEAVLSVATKYL